MFLRNVCRKITANRSLASLVTQKSYFSTTTCHYDKVTVNTDSKTGIALVNMSNSPANSFSLEFATEMLNTIQKLNMEKDVRGIILTSSLPKIFSAGLDIFELYQPKVDRLEKFWSEFQDLWLAIYSSPKTVMAAINGHSVAAGCIVALCTDYRVMRPNFTIGLNETMLGIVAPFWAEDTMKSIIGQRKTEFSLQTGKIYSAEEAFKINLIDELSDDPVKSCEEEMMRWLKIPDHARSLTKLQNRGEVIDRMKKGRKEDVDKLVSFIPKEGIQRTLEGYLTNLKNKKNK